KGVTRRFWLRRKAIKVESTLVMFEPRLLLNSPESKGGKGRVSRLVVRGVIHPGHHVPVQARDFFTAMISCTAGCLESVIHLCFCNPNGRDPVRDQTGAPCVPLVCQAGDGFSQTRALCVFSHLTQDGLAVFIP